MQVETRTIIEIPSSSSQFPVLSKIECIICQEQVCWIFVMRLRHINQVISSLVRKLTKQQGVHDTLDAYYFLFLLLNSKTTLLRLTSNTKMARMDKPTK